MGSSSSSSVHRLAVEEFVPKSRKPPTEQLSPATPSPAPALAYSTLDVVLAAFSGLGYALSARALLLLALVGAFVLSLMAIQSQTLPALEVLVAYCVFTVVPVCFLEIRRRAS